MEKQKEINKIKRIRKQEVKVKVVKEKSWKQKCYDKICYLSKIARADKD
jgi:hypothetical protein